ncbi:ComF family protein [Prevotella dentasini]|uniref:ComF family protein n=1 Tax=Prevotella dentasini TaxID=589537 RepID=UPI00046978F3|nr:phosphoribosyltransferase family protein [Prevotella dentasini]
MPPTISLWSRMFDLLAPRACQVCGRRLAMTEECLCTACNLALPRTGYHQSARDNELARIFWGRIPVEKCSSFFFYHPHSDVGRLIYLLKYFDHPEVGEDLGRLVAQEYQPSGFFDGIGGLLPVPLTRGRVVRRGYNQSVEIARGISSVTHIPILSGAVRRTRFAASQTHKTPWERNENVAGVFRLVRPSLIVGRHILLVDDIITTGATLVSLGSEVLKAEGVKVSILSLGFSKK